MQAGAVPVSDPSTVPGRQGKARGHDIFDMKPAFAGAAGNSEAGVPLTPQKYCYYDNILIQRRRHLPAAASRQEQRMPKAILVAGIYHETHSFLAAPTTLDDFRSSLFHEGQALIDANLGNGSPMDGFLDYAAGKDWLLIPSIHMGADPGGLVTSEVIDVFETRLFADLDANAQKLDAVFLILHGAMVSENHDDVEGAILKGVTSRLAAKGIDIPIVGVLDLHGNVSQEMTDNSSALIAYRENPHSDARETAVRAARILDQLFDDPNVSQVFADTPYVLPPAGVGSKADPMKSVLARARAIEAADPDIININVMAGYAYADIPMCGFSLACQTRGDAGKAKAYLDELTSILEDKLAFGYPHEDVLDVVLEKADALPPGSGPILLIEPADNIGGGTPGDATGILGPLLASGRTGIVAAIKDPESVRLCQEAGLGGTVSLMIGAKTDEHHGRPVPFTGTVRHLSDGRFVLENLKSHMASMGGSNINMGPSAVVENEQAIILLTSIKTAPMDLGHLHSQGVRPEDATYVIVKAAVSHKDAYDPIARASFYVDSEGLCTSNLRRLPYKKLTGKHLSAP